MSLTRITSKVTTFQKYFPVLWQNVSRGLSGSVRAFSAGGLGAAARPVDPDYFEVLGLERSFIVPWETLRTSYKKLMSELHPDRHRLKSSEEQERLHQEASEVTHAYNVISNPHNRAVHLLDLMGSPMDETSSGNLVGSVFLMEIMEIREEIDSTHENPKLKQLMEENQRRIDSVCQRLADAFESEDLESALRLTAMLQYWNRVDETIREKVVLE